MSEGTYFISCYNNSTKELQHYPVPYDVYVYIRQLECALQQPEVSGITKKYPHLKRISR